MEATTINPAQRMIIESFAASHDEEELKNMLRNFYATRLRREMQRLWDNGTLDQTALDTVANELADANRPIASRHYPGD